MFAQSVNENVGGQLDKAAQTAQGGGELAVIAVFLFIGFMALFIITVYFARRKFLPESERKAKFIKLP